MSTERNIVFVVANLAEVALIGAIWLRASGQAPTAGSAFFDGFTLVTQLGLPDLGESGWGKVAVAMTEITALTLLLGGVAVLIAEVQEKVDSSKGEWRGQSKSSLRRRRRNQKPTQFLASRQAARAWRARARAARD